MSSQTSNNNGILFSAAALAAGTVASLIASETEKQILEQEAKKLALEAQRVAADTNCQAAVQIGEDEKAASYADGWGSLISGIAMGGAELGGLGFDYAKAKSNPQLNERITNNKTLQTKLQNPEKGQLILDANRQGEATTEGQIAEAKEKLKKWNPDRSLNDYQGRSGLTGAEAFDTDLAIVNRADGSNEGSIIEALKKETRYKLKTNTKDKQTTEAALDEWKSKLKQFGQSAGYLGTGWQNMERGEAQKDRGIEECEKSIADFLSTSAKANADSIGNVVHQGDEVKDKASEILANAIAGNRA